MEKTYLKKLGGGGMLCGGTEPAKVKLRWVEPPRIKIKGKKADKLEGARNGSRIGLDMFYTGRPRLIGRLDAQSWAKRPRGVLIVGTRSRVPSGAGGAKAHEQSKGGILVGTPGRGHLRNSQTAKIGVAVHRVSVGSINLRQRLEPGRTQRHHRSAAADGQANLSPEEGQSTRE